MARIVDISGLLPSNSQSDSPHCGNELRKRFKKVLQDIQVAAIVRIRDVTILQYIDILQYSLLQYNTPDEEYRYIAHCNIL